MAVTSIFIQEIKARRAELCLNFVSNVWERVAETVIDFRGNQSVLFGDNVQRVIPANIISPHQSGKLCSFNKDTGYYQKI